MKKKRVRFGRMLMAGRIKKMKKLEERQICQRKRTMRIWKSM